jgi:hypothetical protein
VRSVPAAVMVLTARPAATIRTGHTPPDRRAPATALSDRETRPTHTRRAGQISPGLPRSHRARSPARAHLEQSAPHVAGAAGGPVRTARPAPDCPPAPACPPSPRARRIPVHPGVQAQRQCGATARQRSRIRTYERAPTTASIHTTCAAHISQDCGMSGPTRAADAAGPSAGVDLQECCPYPEQVGVRVRLRVSVEHSLVATAVRGSR